MICYTESTHIPFQIDDEDFVLIAPYKWYYVKGYAKRLAPSIEAIHLFLLGPAPNGLEWDHENRDSLDNRRFNLRAVSHTVNMRNRKEQVNNTSGITGVHFRKQTNKWRAEIKVNGKSITIGDFQDITDAAIARLEAEQIYWK